MPLTKKVIICLITVIVSFSFFSGCILEDWFEGTTFTLNSWTICDDEGFAGLNITFSCSDIVNIKLTGPDSLICDSDFFFKGEYTTIFHLAEFRHTVPPGQYLLKAYDNDFNEINSQSFSFDGIDLIISSCDQKWWKQDPFTGGSSLMGLRMAVSNNGYTPAYPYNVIVTMDPKENTSLVLPCVILPNESKYVNCFIYRNNTPNSGIFIVSLKDKDENTLDANSFSINIKDNVPVEQYIWQYNGNHRINIPKPENLYSYYTSLDRIGSEDYSLYVFDPYDDQYIDIIIDCIMLGFSGSSDLEKINYVASFVQNLEYKSDSETNSSYEYPRYPVETLFNGNGGGDCEDKAILTASLLYSLGYNVSLLRLPNHMAVGVNLSENANPNYKYYTDSYYFLETTTAYKPCGFIPDEYEKFKSDVIVYPISSRPLIIHNWENNSLTIYTNTEIGDFVKVTMIIQNLGIKTAENIKVVGGFYTINGLKEISKNNIIPSLEPGMKKEVTISVDIPKYVKTWFKTRIYLENEIVDEKESITSFPTI